VVLNLAEEISRLSTQNLETDYLVIGTGAMGLAFADELIRCNPTAHLILVDKHAKPGGHWNDAYSYVSLHQPSAYYGVNSIKLGRGGASLASGIEVLSYFEEVIDKLLNTGRVQYFSMCEYQGEGVLSSIVTPGRHYRVKVLKKTVNSTYMNVQVPSTTPPKYTVAPEVNLVPLNELAYMNKAMSNYVVIGAGKTGIDAILFLLEQGVPADDITWIMSNDSWFMERSLLQPGSTYSWLLSQLDIFYRSNSLDEVYTQLEDRQIFSRLDDQIKPSKFRCATVSTEELNQLRKVKHIVRMGRVQSIDANEIVLAQGRLPIPSNTLYVDCTANPLAKQDSVPVFDGDNITLQSLQMCQQVFSASVIAYVENRYTDDQQKNMLCMPVPHPEQHSDYITAMAGTLVNMLKWERHFSLWLMRSRLSFKHHETIFTVLICGFKAWWRSTLALKNLRQIFKEEFPSQTFPGDPPQ